MYSRCTSQFLFKLSISSQDAEWKLLLTGNIERQELLTEASSIIPVIIVVIRAYPKYDFEHTWLISCLSVQTMTVIPRILLAVICQVTLWSAGNSGALSTDTPCWVGKGVLRRVELLISRSDWPFCNMF